MQWYIKCMQNYAKFSGRARRAEYWNFTLVNFIIGLVMGIFIAFMPELRVLASLYSLVVFIPGLAVSVRRLHDIGKSGVWCFIVFIPLVGGIWFIILMATEGQGMENEYGPDPKGIPTIAL